MAAAIEQHIFTEIDLFPQFFKKNLFSCCSKNLPFDANEISLITRVMNVMKKFQNLPEARRYAMERCKEFQEKTMDPLSVYSLILTLYQNKVPMQDLMKWGENLGYMLFINPQQQSLHCTRMTDQHTFAFAWY